MDGMVDAEARRLARQALQFSREALEKAQRSEAWWQSRISAMDSHSQEHRQWTRDTLERIERNQNIRHDDFKRETQQSLAELKKMIVGNAQANASSWDKTKNYVIVLLVTVLGALLMTGVPFVRKVDMIADKQQSVQQQQTTVLHQQKQQQQEGDE
jgi:hypothetical protein